MSTTSESSRVGLGNAASMANLAKIVNLIESNVKSEEAEVLEEAVRGSTGTGSGSSSSVRLASSSAPRRSACATSYVPKSPQLEEIVFAEPTCTERFARYFVIVIYLCGLCCLGFFLSIYHIFFWDSRMPPVYKGQKKGPAFG
ncbi:uncharacterized protein LOC6525548 [Drosophila yakuba]|uniref:Uncharacterized protein n=1 Tax=Drosophila yakuba TaxID=7245 RepID=B4Q1R6_DROYA|nr:uncharacterized protein LOC6525548 [Drosophila yakuba]XP_039498197.1 uncharacterized protein LOC120455803 [Drosophila santomea]EDX02491.1 uncharacterized protein Dyak_GE17602 [Drosophila yakuba]